MQVVRVDGLLVRLAVAVRVFKYMCRDVIRKQLLRASDWNLFVHSTPENLPLPRRLCQYLVCDIDLDNVA